MNTFGDADYEVAFIVTLFISGWALGGAASLIGGVIASDLVIILIIDYISKGETNELKGNSKAISTVSGIIEGSGTFAAAMIQSLVPHFGNSAFLIYGRKDKFFFC